MAYPNIVLKDKSGKPNTFDGIDTIIAPGHNADGVAEDIIFKKFIEGAVASGSVQMSTGTFYAPATTENEIASIYFSSFEGTNGKPNEIKDGWWVQTISPSPCVLHDDETYFYRSDTSAVVGAESHSSFSSYGKCVTVGNKYAVTKNWKDNDHRPFLVIYQEDRDTLTCFLQYQPTDEDELYARSQSGIHLYGPPLTKSVEIVHGRNEKPDLVFVIPLLVGSSVWYTQFCWGAKSSLASLFDGYLSGYGANYGLVGSNKSDPLENKSNNFALCCPNETTFVYSSDSVILQLGAKGLYLWIAFWGLESLLPSDETT